MPQLRALWTRLQQWTPEIEKPVEEPEVEEPETPQKPPEVLTKEEPDSPPIRSEDIVQEIPTPSPEIVEQKKKPKEEQKDSSASDPLVASDRHMRRSSLVRLINTSCNLACVISSPSF